MVATRRRDGPQQPKKSQADVRTVVDPVHWVLGVRAQDVGQARAGRSGENCGQTIPWPVPLLQAHKDLSLRPCRRVLVANAGGPPPRRRFDFVISFFQMERISFTDS
jgi:hypothetical protein